MATYSIATDTANAKLDEDSLIVEIGNAAIVPAIDDFTVVGDVITITFKAALSGAEQTTLDGVVAAHQGISAEPEPAHVKIDNIPTVEIDKGSHSFDTVVSHNWIDNTTWPATDDSVWLTEPSASTKQLTIPKAEVQFTHDVEMASLTTPGEFYFDIWVYNPLFDTGQSPTADDPSFIPGVSSGNPLRFLYKRTAFGSIKDVFDFGNDHYTMPAAVDGLPSGVTTVRFDYDQKIILRGDQGAQIRFSTKDDLPLGGGTGAFCTVSLVIREDDIPL